MTRRLGNSVGKRASVFGALVSIVLIALALAPAPGGSGRRVSLAAPRIKGVATAPTALLAPANVQPETLAPLGLPARVRDATGVTAQETTYPKFDANGNPAGSVRWRIVDGTGNCCENYLSVNAQGTLFDFGGDYLNFSTDDGQTWRQVVPADPLPNYGEGTVAVAHNGDILGVAWNPYHGDRVVPFKYSVEDEGWYYTTTKLHQPFFDRESIAVIPGPFEVAGQRFPYISVLRGGFPLKTPWLYSFDGLNYFVPNARFMDVLTQADDGKLEIKPDPMLDYIQPAEQSAITPLGNGTAIARWADFAVRSVDTQFAKLNPNTLRWHRFEFASGELPDPGLLRVDSLGRIHYVHRREKGFTYMLSADGGKSWATSRIDIPRPYITADMETAVNGALQLGVVTIHGRDEDAKTNQDFVYKFSLKKNQPKLKEIYLIGDGKGNYGSGVLAGTARFDFPTIVILPDGRLAASFANATTKHPTLAVELP